MKIDDVLKAIIESRCKSQAHTDVIEQLEKDVESAKSHIFHLRSILKRIDIYIDKDVPASAVSRDAIREELQNLLNGE